MIKKVKQSNKKFKFSYTFFIAFLYSLLCGNGYMFLLYTIAVVLHEFIHIFVAKKLGYNLKNFELSILGASMNLEEESFYYNDEIIIAIAGPLFNLFIFILFACGWWFFPLSYDYTFDFAIVNLLVFSLNILPLYSFDGGRIIVSLIEKKINRKIGIDIVRLIGIVFAVILFILFVVSIFFSFNFSLGVVSVFLFISCTNQGMGCYQKINVVSKKQKIKNGLCLEMKTFVFSDSAKLINLYRKLSNSTYAIFNIYDAKKDKNILIDEDCLVFLIDKYGPLECVKNCNVVN